MPFSHHYISSFVFCSPIFSIRLNAHTFLMFSIFLSHSRSSSAYHGDLNNLPSFHACIINLLILLSASLYVYSYLLSSFSNYSNLSQDRISDATLILKLPFNFSRLHFSPLHIYCVVYHTHLVPLHLTATISKRYRYGRVLNISKATTINPLN